MARERGLDRDLGRLAVADLAHHHHVGVRAQDRTERRREREPGALVDLNLVHPAESELDRVFDGDDVDLRPVDLRQRRVERRRLTGARRAGRQDRARRLADDLGELRLHVLVEAEGSESRGLLRLVEQTHDDGLALDRRQGRDTDVEQAPGRGRVERDPAVLRLAALGDVELREDLQAGCDPGDHALRDPLDLVQDAVDAEPHGKGVFLRLEVDVAGAVLGRLEDDRVDEPDERDVRDPVVDLEIVELLLLLLLEQPGLLVQNGAGAEGLGSADEPADLVGDVLARRDGQLELEARREAQLVDRMDVAGIRDSDPEDIPLDGVRDGLDPLEHVQLKLLDRVLCHADDRQVDEGKVVAAREGACDALRGGDSLVEDGLRERAALLGAAADERQPVGRNQPGRLDQAGHERRELVDGKRGRQGAFFGSLRQPGPAGCAQFGEVHEIPRMRYRHCAPRPVARAGNVSPRVPGRSARRGRVVVATGAVGLLCLSAASGAVAPTRRVSLAASGAQGNGHSLAAAVSADGRYVAFYSSATNLVPGDTNKARDVFVRDTKAGMTTRISVAAAGTEADGNSFEPAISADGRYVAFHSDASNLVPGDTNGADDVFVKDRQTGATTRVSVNTAGAEADGGSYTPAMSADGRLVAFLSDATNIVPGDTNQARDVFVHDVATGTTFRVSVNTAGDQAQGGPSASPEISADGR